MLGPNQMPNMSCFFTTTNVMSYSIQKQMVVNISNYFSDFMFVYTYMLYRLLKKV